MIRSETELESEKERGKTDKHGPTVVCSCVDNTSSLRTHTTLTAIVNNNILLVALFVLYCTVLFCSVRMAYYIVS